MAKSRLEILIESKVDARIKRHLEEIGKSAKKSEKPIINLRKALAAIGTGVAAKKLFDFARASVEAGIAVERINNTLRAATGSADAAAVAYGFVTDEAERLGLDLRTTAEQFGRFSAAARGTSLEGQGVRDVFTAVAEASTVMGLSAEQAGGALTALEQIVSKGKVSAEELRGQLGERLPGAFQIAARAIGVTTADLDKMLVSGQLTAEELLPALAAELRRTFGPEVQQASQGTLQNFNRLQTAMFTLRAEIAKELNPEIGELARQLAELGSDPAALNLFKGLGQSAAAVVSVFTKLSTVIAVLRGAFATLTQTVIEVFVSLSKLEDALSPFDESKRTQRIQDLADAFGEVAGEQFAVASASDLGAKAARKFGEELDRALGNATGGGGGGGLAGQFATDLEAVNAAIAQGEERIEQLNQKIIETKEHFAELRENREFISEDFEKFGSGVSEVADDLESIQPDLEDLFMFSQDAADEFERIKESLEQSEDPTLDLIKQVRQLGQMAGIPADEIQALVNAIREADAAFQAFVDTGTTAKGVFAQLASILGGGGVVGGIFSPFVGAGLQGIEGGAGSIDFDQLYQDAFAAIANAFIPGLGTVVGPLVGAILGDNGADAELRLAQTEAFNAALGRLGDQLAAIDPALTDIISGFRTFVDGAGRIVVQLGDVENKFRDVESAIEFMLSSGLGRFDSSGLDANTQAVLENSIGGAEQLLSDLSFAAELAFAALTPLQQSLQDLSQTYQEQFERAAALGLSLDQVNDLFLGALGNVRDDILGVNKSEREIREERARQFNAFIESERARLEAEKALLEAEMAQKQAELELRIALERALLQATGSVAETIKQQIELLSTVTEEVLDALQDQIDAIGKVLDELPDAIDLGDIRVSGGGGATVIDFPSVGGGGGRNRRLEKQTDTARLLDQIARFDDGPLESLVTQFFDLTVEAQRLGIATADLQAAYEQAVKDFEEQLKGPIDDILREIQTGTRFGQLPGESLGATQTLFDDAVARALAGDEAAFGDAARLASQLLDLGVSQFGTATGEFQSLLGGVESDLEALSAAEVDAPGFEELLESADAQLEVMEDTNNEISRMNNRLASIEDLLSRTLAAA